MPNDYLLKEVVGEGGMGCVYKGVTPNGQETAIKMLKCEYVSIPDFKEFFHIEANALKEMNHPSVVKIMGDPFSDKHGNMYLPMEFVHGETLEHRVKTSGPFSESEARQIMCKILDAFTYIHSQRKIHRDIKPSNIMLKPDGEICVIDFGIAKDMKTSTGKTIGRCVGTDGYMSPEQVNGNSIDYRTDIYSLGCLLHFMLTGKHAIIKQSSDYKTVVAILNNEFPSAKKERPELTDEIQKIIFRAVDKNMLKRYQTAMDFKKALLGDSDETIRGTKAISCSTVTVGRNKQNDIVINNDYVSGNHLTIQYKKDAKSNPFLEFIDHSSNGTGINGEYVHNSTKIIPFNLNYASTQNIPSVLLAGREETSLNMREVCSLLQSKFPEDDSDTIQPPPSPPSPPSLPTTDSLSVLLCILSFLCPIAGWVLASVWKDQRPQSSRTACILAWIGFVVNIIITIISVS